MRDVQHEFGLIPQCGTMLGVAAERSTFVAFVELGLHYNDSGSLKGKRKEVSSLKALLRQRFGASVAETVGARHLAADDAALRPGRGPGDRAPRGGSGALCEARCPEGCSVKIDLRSLEDIRG